MLVFQFYFCLLVAFICLFHGYNVHMQVTDCGVERRRDPDTNCTQCRDGLDLSTNCTTCLSPLPIQCEGRDPNCTIGHFTFSALFHSYTPNSKNNVRLIYCVQPHGSPPFSSQLPPQTRLNFNNFSIPQGFIVQNTTNPDVNWNRSNPYTVELRLWTGQIQFYIIAYNFPGGRVDGLALDMFLIDLTLNIGPTFTDRTTYYGIMGSTVTFDLSFRVQCSENYYGHQCNVFCSEVDQRLSCDNEGNVVCVNQYRNPETNCSECLPGRDPVKNCLECLPGKDPTTNCLECLQGKNLTTNCVECLLLRDPDTNCVECLPGRDITTNCAECLPLRDPSTNCIGCLPGRDITTNCTECLPLRDPNTNCIGCLPGRDITTNCAECLPLRDPSTNCIGCLPGRDITTNCTKCLPLRDPNTNCERCLPGRDINTNCSNCLSGWDPTKDCAECLPGRDLATNCLNCLLEGRDPATNCLECLPGRDPASNCSEILSDSSQNGLLIGAAAGGLVVGIVLIVLIILLCIFLVWTVKKRRNKEDHDLPDVDKTKSPKVEHLMESRNFSNPIYSKEVNEVESDDKNSLSAVRPQTLEQRNFDNPLYGNETTDGVYSQTSHPVTSHSEMMDGNYSKTSHSLASSRQPDYAVISSLDQTLDPKYGRLSDGLGPTYYDQPDVALNQTPYKDQLYDEPDAAPSQTPDPDYDKLSSSSDHHFGPTYDQPDTIPLVSDHTTQTYEQPATLPASSDHTSPMYDQPDLPLNPSYELPDVATNGLLGNEYSELEQPVYSVLEENK